MSIWAPSCSLSVAGMNGEVHSQADHFFWAMAAEHWLCGHQTTHFRTPGICVAAGARGFSSKAYAAMDSFMPRLLSRLEAHQRGLVRSIACSSRSMCHAHSIEVVTISHHHLLLSAMSCHVMQCMMRATLVCCCRRSLHWWWDPSLPSSC